MKEKTILQPYTGFYAQFYDRLFDSTPCELDFYRYFLPCANGFALEIGCGTGQLIGAYTREGFAVDGLDCSQEMLELCDARLREHNVQANLFLQSMQTMSLNRIYQMVYIPSCAFTLVLDYAQACAALEKIYEHVAPGGTLLLSYFLIWPELLNNQEDVVRIWKNVNVGPHEQLIVYESLRYYSFNALREGTYRFELYKHGILVATQIHTIVWRIYSYLELKNMLVGAGFSIVQAYGDYTLEPAADYHNTIILQAVKRA